MQEDEEYDDGGGALLSAVPRQRIIISNRGIHVEVYDPKTGVDEMASITTALEAAEFGIQTGPAVPIRTAQDIIREFNDAYSFGGVDCELVAKLRKGGLNDDQIAVAIEAVETTCWSCHNGPADCQCWNDE